MEVETKTVEAVKAAQVPDDVTEVDEGVKRSSLSKFFHFRGFSKSSNDVSADTEMKLPKSNTLTRLFAKKDKDAEKGGVVVEPRRSLLMRGFVIPWISRKPSQMNLQKPLELSVVEDDDSTPQEIATSSEIF